MATTVVPSARKTLKNRRVEASPARGSRRSTGPTAETDSASIADWVSTLSSSAVHRERDSKGWPPRVSTDLERSDQAADTPETTGSTVGSYRGSPVWSDPSRRMSAAPEGAWERSGIAPYRTKAQ